MKIEKRTDPKHPYKAILSDGTEIIVPRQGKFTTTWLRKHGCPFVSQWVVMQWIGLKEWNIMKLYEWAKKNVKKNFAATLTMRGERNCINHHVKGHGYAKFFAPKDITVDKMTSYLKAGAMIIITRRKPSVHYYCVVMDKGEIWTFNYQGCGVKKHSVKFLVSTKCLSAKYGGMIVVTRAKKATTPKKKATPKKTTTTTKKTAETKKTEPKKATAKKVTKKVVDDVIAGKYGNGDARKKALEKAGYDYKKVQTEVNKRLK